jgi:hypothetical protein
MATREQWVKYQKEKDEYESKILEYESSLRQWNFLTDEEREHLHKNAESNSRMMWSLGVAAVVSFFLYTKMQKNYSGDSFWFTWGGASAVIFIIAALGNKIFGLLARSLVIACVAGAVSYLGIALLQHNASIPPSNELGYWVVAIVSVISFLAALVGHRASAKPSRPTRPTRPT